MPAASKITSFKQQALIPVWNQRLLLVLMSSSSFVCRDTPDTANQPFCRIQLEKPSEKDLKPDTRRNIETFFPGLSCPVIQLLGAD